MKYVALGLSLILTACVSTPKVPLENSVAVQMQESQSINVPIISKPPKFAPQKFKFQDPKDKTSIVGMDATNYAALRGFILDVNKRDMIWDSRLTEANKSILLLQKKSK